MSQLPGACCNQDDDLGDAVPDSLRVRSLAEVSVVSFPLALVLLFSSDIFYFLIEVTNLGSEARDMGAVVLDVTFGGADDDIEIQPNVGVTEPRGMIRGETDGVVAGVVGCKGEFSFLGTGSSDQDVSRLGFLEVKSCWRRVVWKKMGETYDDFYDYPKLGVSVILLLVLAPFECTVIAWSSMSKCGTCVAGVGCAPSTTVSVGSSSTKHRFWFASR